MSVLKAHRSESKAEFVNVANKIYIQTIAFLSRLSSRYSRLVSKSVSELASEVVDHAEKANSIYPSDAARKELRKQQKITQDELAYRANIGRSTLGNIETAQNDVTFSKINQLAQAFELSLSEFLNF